MYEYGDGIGHSDRIASGCDSNRWHADLYDNVSGTLCGNDIGYGLQLGRTGYRLRWYIGEPDCEFIRNLHCDSHELG